MLDRSRLEIRLGDFAIGSATALADARLLPRVQEYRRQLALRMVPLDASEIKQRLSASDYHVSRKIDGEFDVLVFDEGEALLLNPGGTVRIGLPALVEAAARLKRGGVQRALVAGELNYARPDGKRPRVHDVSRAARQPESRADLDALQFSAFDLMEINGEPPPTQFAPVWKQLTELFGSGERVGTVEAVALRDPSEVEKQFRKWVGQGAEGAVVRSDAAGLFKIKPRHTIDAAVIGFTEGTDDRQGLIHDLLLALMRPDGTFHVLGRVGGGFSTDDRRNFLSDLKDLAAESDYAEVNDHVAYQMVRPEWVIEISVLDLLTETTRGAPINRMVLDWNREGGRWQIVRRMPLVGLISPQFIRRREDKRICPHDLRLQQISELVEIPLLDRDARKLALPRSALLRREVYTRMFKGQLMVRKLVLWETNKAQESDDYPAYVIHFTDFSANRKTPLEREVRISNSRDQIGQLWEALAAENIKKGWELVGAATPALVTAEPPAKALPPEPPPAEAAPAEAAPAEAKKPRAQKKPKAEAEVDTDAAPAAPAKKPRGRAKPAESQSTPA
jgi:hypothetical protein